MNAKEYFKDDKKLEKEEKVELTPEQEQDEILMQNFLDEDVETEEINFGL